MCMICKGLKNNKLSIEEAKEKYQEFLDLELLDEEHQEKIEELLAEFEEDESYWGLAWGMTKKMESDDEAPELDSFEKDYELDNEY